MKKAIVLMLALVLTMGLAVPAAAAGTSSPTAPTTSEEVTAPLPEVVETETTTEDGTVVVVEAVSVDDVEALPEEAKETLVAAQTTLAEAAPADMKPQFFFYVKTTVKDEGTGEAKQAGPVAVTVKVSNVKTASDVVAKQFINGKWVELKVIVNEDGTITIEGVLEGPMAIFTK